MNAKMTSMNANAADSSKGLDDVKRVGTGIALMLFPLIFAFAFAVHPGLLTPHRLTDEQLILRAHHNSLLAFGHAMVLLDAALLIVVASTLMRLLSRTSAAWWGFLGAVTTVISAVALAAEKGSESLTISALDTLPENQFTQMMPGLVQIFSHQGWMILVMGVMLLAVGFTLFAVGFLTTGVIPRWQGALLLGIWLLGWPDGEEIYALAGSILLAFALVPLGIQLMHRSPA